MFERHEPIIYLTGTNFRAGEKINPLPEPFRCISKLFGSENTFAEANNVMYVLFCVCRIVKAQVVDKLTKEDVLSEIRKASFLALL